MRKTIFNLNAFRPLNLDTKTRHQHTPNYHHQESRPRDHGARAAVRASQLILAHATTALPNSGGMVLSDLVIIAVASDQFAVHGYDEYLVRRVWAAIYARQASSS